MANAKIRAQKEQVVETLVERLKGSATGVFVTYSGLTVEKDTELRTKLREAGVEYTVVKNTLTERAVEAVGFDEIKEVLNGTTALATHVDDVVAPAKVLAKFIEDNGDEAGIKIKAGFVDGRVATLEEINAMAKVPSKDTLYAMLAGGLNACISGLARALNAVAEKNGEGEQPA